MERGDIGVPRVGSDHGTGGERIFGRLSVVVGWAPEINFERRCEGR